MRAEGNEKRKKSRKRESKTLKGNECTQQIMGSSLHISLYSFRSRPSPRPHPYRPPPVLRKHIQKTIDRQTLPSLLPSLPRPHHQKVAYQVLGVVGRPGRASLFFLLLPYRFLLPPSDCMSSATGVCECISSSHTPTLLLICPPSLLSSLPSLPPSPSLYVNVCSQAHTS